MIKMKCELGYVKHRCIGAYKETTRKEFLIITAFATLITLFLNWLIGTTYTQIVASVFFVFSCVRCSEMRLYIVRTDRSKST